VLSTKQEEVLGVLSGKNADLLGKYERKNSHNKQEEGNVRFHLGKRLNSEMTTGQAIGSSTTHARALHKAIV